MRAIITGQIGLDKKTYLENVSRIAKTHGESLTIYNIGDMMYREAPDVRPGRILDLPLARLNSLRRAVFRDVLADAPKHKNVLVNTHATFRWKHGLFSAVDFDQLAQFQADLYVTLVDNIETVHQRLLRDHDFEHTLKDLMVWREEEILATELLSMASRLRTSPSSSSSLSSSSSSSPFPSPLSPLPSAQFFVLSRGRDPSGPGTAETLFRLMLRPNMKTVYPSFPMSHVMDMPDTLAEINTFRAAMAAKFITFDPGDVDEKILADMAIKAAQTGKQTLTIYPSDPSATAAANFGAIVAPTDTPASPQNPGVTSPGSKDAIHLKVSDVLQIVPDIDGQIYSRDFILVRQSELIVSYIPELPGGKPGLSSGVERELQHAHEHARDVYVIWKPKKEPSPFVTQTANKVFRSVEEAMTFFEQKGYFTQYNLFGT